MRDPASGARAAPAVCSMVMPRAKKKAPPRKKKKPPHAGELIKLSVAMLPARFDRGEGFLDLVLPIATVEGGGARRWKLEARGALDGTPVGLIVELEPAMSPGISEDGDFDHDAFYPRGVTLRSIGADTTNLMRALAGAYGVAHDGGEARASLPLTAFSMRGDPRRLDQAEVRFKVFKEARVQRQYELYVHVDLPRRRLTLREKDAVWRVPLIQAWLR
jgi:hypothetical protein